MTMLNYHTSADSMFWKFINITCSIKATKNYVIKICLWPSWKILLPYWFSSTVLILTWECNMPRTALSSFIILQQFLNWNFLTNWEDNFWRPSRKILPPYWFALMVLTLTWKSKFLWTSLLSYIQIKTRAWRSEDRHIMKFQRKWKEHKA